MHSKTIEYLAKFDNQHEFERMSADILNAQGYRDVALVAPPGGGDRGRDIAFSNESGEKGLACITLNKGIEVKFKRDFHIRTKGDYDKYMLFCTVYLTHSQKLRFTKYCIDTLRAEFVPMDIEAMRRLLDSSLKSIRKQYLYIGDNREEINVPVSYQIDALNQIIPQLREDGYESFTTRDLDRFIAIPSLRDNIKPQFEPLVSASVMEGLQTLINDGIVEIEGDRSFKLL
jgi:hypothetical protein